MNTHGLTFSCCGRAINVTPVQGNGVREIGSGLAIDSAEKVFFENSRNNISLTDALERTIGAWLIIFFILKFRE